MSRGKKRRSSRRGKPQAISSYRECSKESVIWAVFERRVSVKKQNPSRRKSRTKKKDDATRGEGGCGKKEGDERNLYVYRRKKKRERQPGGITSREEEYQPEKKDRSLKKNEEYCMAWNGCSRTRSLRLGRSEGERREILQEAEERRSEPVRKQKKFGSAGFGSFSQKSFHSWRCLKAGKEKGNPPNSQNAKRGSPLRELLLTWERKHIVRRKKEGEMAR